MHSLAQHWIENIVLQSPVAQTLSITARSADIDHVTLVMPYSAALTTTPGVLHGGAVATLIDTIGAAASASGISPDDEPSGGATMSLTVNYLAPASTDLTATGTVVHRTRSATLTEVHVTNAAGDLVATGQVSSRIFH
ncbi:PaaI family thioesterase [Agromyces subbeticus]|uniref:PaaI family thioesterase n=1 Tax=Agromyces subbeticus TaxID=293890 RepID=UPI0003B425DA|nr:PaaI family thioesterase [Agromyces subbeticus]